MTFAEQRAEVFRRLAESSTSPVFYSVADVDTALNEGYAELSDASEWNEQHLDVDLLNNRPYYDARTVIGASFLAFRSAFDVQTNRWLIPSSIRELDAHDRRWEFGTGEPQRVITRGLWWLGLWPRVQSDTGGVITQYYVGLPSVMVDDSDEPGFPEAFHLGCVEFALADLWIQDGESAAALAAWTAYLAYEAGLIAWVDGRAEGPRLHGFGESRLSGVAR
jgi:hypothetical protein